MDTHAARSALGKLALTNVPVLRALLGSALLTGRVGGKRGDVGEPWREAAGTAMETVWVQFIRRGREEEHAAGQVSLTVLECESRALAQDRDQEARRA